MIKEAQRLGLIVHSIQYPHLGPDGERLVTDVINTPIDPTKATFVFMSGCHGIEGYLGSSIQKRFLNRLNKEIAHSFNLIIVHALNPYGMAWYRRVNAKNIDLNRCFFLDEKRPVNSSFDAVLPLLS